MERLKCDRRARRGNFEGAVSGKCLSALRRCEVRREHETHEPSAGHGGKEGQGEGGMREKEWKGAPASVHTPRGAPSPEAPAACRETALFVMSLQKLLQHRKAAYFGRVSRQLYRWAHGALGTWDC